MSFVDRKNYRLQDIQLSKITRGNKPRGKLLVAAGLVPPDPLGSLTRGDPNAPLRSLALRQRPRRVSVNSRVKDLVLLS